MKTKIALLTTTLTFLFAGCATKPLTMNYSPSSIMSAEGEVEVSDFRYIPGEGEKVEPNQIRNTALGKIKFDKDIDQIIKESVFKELRFVGVTTKSEDTVLSGEIIEFLIGDLGYSIDWTLEIKYILKSKSTGDIIWESTKKTEKNTNKFGNVFGQLNEIIKTNIEELIKDEDFLSNIQK
jgi:uncharacterized lipoprotein